MRISNSTKQRHASWCRVACTLCTRIGDQQSHPPRSRAELIRGISTEKAGRPLLRGARPAWGKKGPNRPRSGARSASSRTSRRRSSASRHAGRKDRPWRRTHTACHRHARTDARRALSPPILQRGRARSTARGENAQAPIETESRNRNLSAGPQPDPKPPNDATHRRRITPIHEIARTVRLGRPSQTGCPLVPVALRPRTRGVPEPFHSVTCCAPERDASSDIAGVSTPHPPASRPVFVDHPAAGVLPTRRRIRHPRSVFSAC